MSSVVEYDCEGCGMHISAFGREAVPAHGFCVICEWLCEFVTDPVQIQAIREKQGMLMMTARPSRREV